MTDTTDTEKAIVQAARQVFLEKGLAGARMQEIADAAKVNKALLNYYFRSKEKLFQIVFEEAFQNLFTTTAQLLSSDLSFEEKIRSIIENEFGVISQTPQMPLFILNEVAKNKSIIQQKMTNSRVKKVLDAFSKEVDKAVRTNAIRPIGGEELFINIISLVMFPFVGQNLFNTLYEHRPAEQQKLLKARQEQVVQFVLKSIQK